jgi:methyl-accepting chemotaxis protein
MNADQLAALIAASFFAVGVCAGVYVLIRLARLITAATVLVTSYQAGADDLMRRARTAVDRADEQLARTGALSQSVEQVSASMSELSEQVSAVAGTARLIANALGTPVLRLAAAGHGVRRALAIRRSAPASQLVRRDDQAPRRALGARDARHRAGR